MTSVCFGTAGVPPSGEPGRQGMTARQETIDRYRHFRAIAKQHLGGALKHLSRTAIKEAAQRLGLWSRGKLVMDSPDELGLVFDVAVFGEFSKSGGDHTGFGAARCRMRSGKGAIPWAVMPRRSPR